MSSNSVSGLSSEHRAEARGLVRAAAFLAYNHKDKIHYTQGPGRWQGIATNRKAFEAEYPTEADCSSFATWCLWNGLSHFKVRDTVNGQSWKGGYTGTMLDHGKRVIHLGNVLIGDLVIYGKPGSTGGHVAIVVGFNTAHTPMVMSHGSEAGPYYLPWNYRDDIMEIRRYI